MILKDLKNYQNATNHQLPSTYYQDWLWQELTLQIWKSDLKHTQLGILKENVRKNRVRKNGQQHGGSVEI